MGLLLPNFNIVLSQGTGKLRKGEMREQLIHGAVQTKAIFIQYLLKLLYYMSMINGQSVGSVTQSCLTLCYPMNCSMPGLPVDHQLLKFTQTHVHRGGDVIQPSHPLLSPSSPTPNPSQHQGLFQ